MRKFLVFLIFLVILVAVADRGLHYAAESEIAKRVSQRYPMTTEPEVTIAGFPFLTQAVEGTYSEIAMVTSAFVYNDVQLERVEVELRDVHAPLSKLMSDPEIVASTAEGTVLLPYSELQQRLPEGMRIEQENGSPRIAGDFAVAGFSVPVAADLELSVSDSVLSVRPDNVELGEVPVDPGPVAERLSFDFQIPELPFGLRITDVQQQPNGVRIAARGEDVPLTRESQEP